MDLEPNSELQEQIKTITSEIENLEKLTTYHRKIQKNNTIPRTFLPKQLPTNSLTLTENFKQEFKSLFFKYVKATINSNIEIKKARRQDLINTTLQISSTPTNQPTTTNPRKRNNPNPMSPTNSAK